MKGREQLHRLHAAFVQPGCATLPEHFLHCASRRRRVVEYFIPRETERSMLDASIRKEAAQGEKGEGISYSDARSLRGSFRFLGGREWQREVW